MGRFHIQYLDYNLESEFEGPGVTRNRLETPQSLDVFEDLRMMIRYSQKTKILIVLPQNCTYQFDSELQPGTGRRYFNREVDIKRLLGKYFEKWINAISFLPVGALIHFLDGTGFIQLEEKVPDWIQDLEMFDDADMKQAISEREAEILHAQKEIEKANAKLAKNNKYKSILYTNGDELVTVIFDMLEQMLECDLSGFKDEKKEDFLIRLDDITLIGEIKGVTSNIKNEHVSQLDMHYQGYLDKIENEPEGERVKALLIMDHQRNNRLEDRQPVHENQIRLAKRNGSLIVETHTLLRLFERWRENRMDRTQTIALLKEREGLLSLSDEA